MNQKQHTSQQLLLKQFQHRRQLVVVDRNSLNIQDPKPSPKKAGYLIDFQSDENERMDNQNIETPASMLLKGFKTRTGKRSTADTPDRDHWFDLQLTPDERAKLDKWIALHLTRSPRDISDLSKNGVRYDRARVPSLDDSLRMTRFFREVWKYECPDNSEPLILSDQPIVQFSQPGTPNPNAMYFPFGHKLLIVLSNADPSYNAFTGRTWSEVANEMSLFNSHERFYCNPKFTPDLYELKRRSDRTTKSTMKSQLRIPSD